jgi:hypothetical protein
VFLGNWMPTQEADRSQIHRRRFGRRDRRQPDRREIHARGARLHLRRRAARLRGHSALRAAAQELDLRHRARQRRQPLVLKMLKQNFDNLGDFKLVESSEQGMLAQVERAVRDKEPIVFLAWEPHPMNMRFDLRYLSGGDACSDRTSAARRSTRSRARATVASARTSAGCCQPEVHAARRERNDGGDPGSARAAESRRGRMAQGQPASSSLARRRADLRRPPGAERAAAVGARRRERLRAAGSSATRFRSATRWPSSSMRSSARHAICSTAFPS